MKRPLITDINGKEDYNIWFRFGDDTSYEHSCSLVFKNQMLVFGGDQSPDQISIVRDLHFMNTKSQIIFIKSEPKTQIVKKK